MKNIKCYIVWLFLIVLSTGVGAQSFNTNVSQSNREISPLILSSTSSLRLKQANTRNLGVYFNTMNQELNVGRKKKISGIIFTAIGVGLLATGIGLVATADDLYYSASVGTGGSSSSGDLGGALGILAIPGSVGFLIPGIHKWAKGGRMYRQEKAEGEFVKMDNKGKWFDKLWCLSTSGSLPIGNDLRTVYGPGFSMNTGLGFGISKNRIKVGPCLGYDLYSKQIVEENVTYYYKLREKNRIVMGGISLGYLHDLNKAKTISIYPSMSLYRANVKDYYTFNGRKTPILKGAGTAAEMKLSLVFKSLMLGASYMHLRPTMGVSDDLVEVIEGNNDLYPLSTVSKTDYKVNFSSIKFSIGIVL